MPRFEHQFRHQGTCVYQTGVAADYLQDKRMEENNQINNTGLMPANSQIRAIARGELYGNWTQPVLCTLVYFLVSGFASGIGTIASLLITAPLGFGFIIAYLNFMRGVGRSEMVGQPFKVFNQYGRYLGTSLLVTLFIFLWTLLLIVPGIIKSYSYAMTAYIMNDHPELGAEECIDKSMEMMDGYKWKLFLMDLSFIGWALLCILTCGIGFLWLTPYVSCSHAKFYEELKARTQE